MFDEKLQKHDLNPLIKLNGGYLVDDSDPDTTLFINVCRDIGKSWLRKKGGAWSVPAPDAFDRHILIRSLRELLS